MESRRTSSWRCHRRLHRVGMLFPQPRRALEIGEQERHRPRRQLRHRVPLPLAHSICKSSRQTGPRRESSMTTVVGGVGAAPTRRKRTIPASRCGATDQKPPCTRRRGRSDRSCGSRTTSSVTTSTDDGSRTSTLDGENFEEELLRKGYARLLVIEPNHAHEREMLDDELNARARRVGVRDACGDES